jgi:hypothetical protein
MPLQKSVIRESLREMNDTDGQGDRVDDSDRTQVPSSYNGEAPLIGRRKF